MSGQLPVLIVGAGPSGLAMACAFAHLKVPYRIVDKNSSPVSTSNAVWLQPRTLEFFNMLGAADAFLKKGNRCRGMSLQAGGKPLGRIPFDQNASPYPFVLMLPQKLTEKMLIEHLSQLGGTVERSVTVTDLSETPDHMLVTMQSSQGKTETLPVSWVVACDGSSGVVRDLCGVAYQGTQLPGQFVVADAKMDSFLPQDELHVFFRKETLCAVFPLGSQHYRISANLHQSHPRKIFTDIEVREIVAERTDGNYNVAEISWISPFWAQSRLIDQMRQGRVFFIGDAAHTHSPAGGQGLNAGIQDAANLAFKLGLVMHGNADIALLDTYHLERHPVISRTVTQAEHFTRIVQSKISLRKQWNELIAPSPETMPAEIGRQITQLGVCYTDSPVIDFARRADAGVPQSGVCAPDIRAQGGLVYKALRDMRHLVLIFTGTDDLPAWRTLQQALEKKYADLVRVLRVVQGGLTDAGVLADPDGSLHTLYGVKTAALYVIRPDGHIAACADRPDSQPVDKVFALYRSPLL